MPNPSSGAVPIPTINQTVQTPTVDLSPNPFHAEPIANLGQAIGGVGQGLTDIFLKQKQHADAIDVASRMDQFAADLGQAKVKALNSGQTGPQMVAGFQADAGKLMNSYTNPDPASPNPPPNHAVARQLALAMQQHTADQMSSFPSEAAERVSHDLDFKFAQQTSTAAASIGQNYTIAGTADAPVFQLNADGLSAMQRQIAAIDQAYPPNSRPTENAFYRNQLAQKAALQTGMSVAQDHPTLIDKYIDQHSAMIPPEQQMSLLNQATEAIRRPAQQLDAANANLDAQLTNQYLQQVHDGNLNIAQLDDDAAHQRISRVNYQKITGYQFMPPGNPGAIAAMQKQISSATDENDLETLRGTINGPANAELYGKGAIPLNAAIENAKHQMNTVAGQTRVSAYDQIKRAFQTIPGAGLLGVKMYNMSASLAGSPTLTELQTNAKADFEAAIYGETNPAKIRAAMQKAIRDNAPDTSLVKPTTGPPSPAPSWIPHRRPGESLSAYGARVKAASPGSPGTTVPAVGPPAITDDEARTITAHARKIGLIR